MSSICFSESCINCKGFFFENKKNCDLTERDKKIHLKSGQTIECGQLVACSGASKGYSEIALTFVKCEENSNKYTEVNAIDIIAYETIELKETENE